MQLCSFFFRDMKTETSMTLLQKLKEAQLSAASSDPTLGRGNTE